MIEHRRRLGALAQSLRERFVAVGLALLAASCGGDTSNDSENHADGGVKPPDAGLQPDAKLEDCLSDEGTRICGTNAGCYQDGPACHCEHVPTATAWDGGVPDFGVCSGPIDLSPCGACNDGQVCVAIAYEIGANCASESLGRLFWMHGEGDLVLYADYTPYTGEPLPKPTECPPPKGELTLCGGNCGGCDVNRLCSGRSPTHPWGICVDNDPLHCETTSDCADGKACLLLSAGPAKPSPFYPFYPSLCVSAADCPSYAAAIPGGAKCN